MGFPYYHTTNLIKMQVSSGMLYHLELEILQKVKVQNKVKINNMYLSFGEI